MFWSINTLFKIFLITFFTLVKSEEIKIFENSGHIEFAKIMEFKLNFKDLESKTTNFFIQHSFLSIIANVTIENECNKKSEACSQPIRIYGKINDSPRPEDLIFDKKDDTGKFEGKTVLYGFEYSPCQLNLNDTLYIKIVGVEGKSNFSLSVTYNYLDNYKVLCAGGKEPQISLYSSSVSTPLGTIKYGGKINGTYIDDKMYLLKGGDGNLNWEIISSVSREHPSPRYGHFMTYYDNHLILFGGSNDKEQIFNDLWVFDLSSFKWTKINYANTKNVPSPKFLASGEIISNHGKIIIYGGKNNFDDTNIYILDIKILFELIHFNELYSDSSKNGFEDYATKANHLWTIIEMKDLVPRYGLSITQVKHNEVMFFGGVDRSDYSLSRLEILNLDNFSVKVVEPDVPSEFPYARGFHQILKYGPVFILYGGKIGTGENLNDMWKFIVNTRKWIKVSEPVSKNRDFYLYKSGFIFTKIQNTERPVIYGGENRNRETSNVLILLDFEICTSDVKIFTDYACIPCTEGYYLSRDRKCVGCSPGKYLKQDGAYYADSKCEECPAGNYNDKYFQKDISSCKICSFGTFNSATGQKSCESCPNNKLCLSGSSEPKEDQFLIKEVVQDYQSDVHYPDFMDTNSKIKTISRTSALIIVAAITGTMVLVLFICYKIRKSKVTKFLIDMDFIPLTGGATKKCSGGLISLIYSILIISLAFSFVMRYIYFNELIEVIPIARSNTEQDSLMSTLQLDVVIVGNNFQCINQEDKLTNNTFRCHKEIEISKLNHKEYFLTNIKALTCSHTPEGYCKVTFKCEDCNSIVNKDIIQVSINNPKAFVQLYHWTFSSLWAENFDFSKGYSTIDGIFKPDDNIKTDYVFKGEIPSTIHIFLSPIFYYNQNENLRLSGFRASLNKYTKGSVRNELNFYQTENGFYYMNNSLQINAKKQIEFLDFYAFILGMLAGFSFLSRVSKYFCERCGLFDISMENYVELEEEKSKDEKLEKLETGKQNDNNPPNNSSENVSNNQNPNLNIEMQENQNHGSNANSGYPLNPQI